MPISHGPASSDRTITATTGQKVAITGRFPRRDGRRPIRLQRLSGHTWKVVARGRTTPRGLYRISVKAPARATSYRVVAPRVRRAGRTLPARTSPITVVGPRSTPAPAPGDVGVITYEVVALGSKTIERGIQSDATCGAIAATRTRQTTGTRPTSGSPKTWREGAPEDGVRSVNIYPDVFSTYVDDLSGCKTSPVSAEQVVPCQTSRDQASQYPTDRMTVSVRIPRGATMGEVVFFPPSARNLGYPGAWDESCRVKELRNGAPIPLADRTQRVPVSVLLGWQPFKVHSAGIFKDDSTRDGVRTELRSTWDQSITLRRVPSR
jgi:hypothetical protein